MTKEEQKAVEEFTEMNLTKKGLYHYNDMQDAFLIGLFKGEKMQPSLPSDLEEAAEKYSENILANNEDLQDAIEDAFKAGAEWMAGQFQQEQPEVDLEKAAEQYSQNILAGEEDMFDAIADGFIAGAKWIEEQMKNTVDGHCFVSPVDPSVLFVQTEHFENKKGFRHGETCKVIVLKKL